MGPLSPDSDNRVRIVREYFRRCDAGTQDVVDLLTDDVQIYFPKYGIGVGRPSFFEFGSAVMATLESISHDVDNFKWIVADDAVVVEGTTRGVTRSGVAWEGGKTPGGRFCSTFEFRNDLISRMFIYLDPDFAGADRERFLWPEGSRRTW